MRYHLDTARKHRRTIGRSIKRVLLIASCVSVLTACQSQQSYFGTGKTSANHAEQMAQGIALLRQREFAAAYKHFRAMNPLSTGNSQALSGLGIAADMQADEVTAKRVYKALEATQTDNAMFYNNRGYSRMLRGELRPAYDDLVAALRFDPNNAIIKNNLAMLRAVLPRSGGL